MITAHEHFILQLPLTFFVMLISHRPLGDILLTVNASVQSDQEILFNSKKSGHVVYFLNKIKWLHFLSIYCYFRTLPQQGITRISMTTH
jgi:hypothetical protein